MCARILYGVMGEGAGHASRSQIIIEHLIRSGHVVKIVSSSQGYDNLSRLWPVEKITGFNFVYNSNNEVDYLPTMLKGLMRLAGSPPSIIRLRQIVDDFKPQIVFTDFEPFSAMVAFVKKLPLISIDNQHILTNTNVVLPAKYRADAMIAKKFINYFIPRAKSYLVTSFFPAVAINKKTFVFPPILRDEVLRLPTSTKDYLLVYSTSYADGIIEILEQLPIKCVVYGLQKNGVSAPHISLKKKSSTEFLTDLANCAGIIATAGFTLLGEALYLGKPYLALPVRNQFEQFINAYYLQKLGWGMYSEKLNVEQVRKFVAALPAFRKKLIAFPRSDNKKLFLKIDRLVESCVKWRVPGQD